MHNITGEITGGKPGADAPLLPLGSGVPRCRCTIGLLGTPLLSKPTMMKEKRIQ